MIVAHHPLVTALPLVIPAVVLVAVLLGVVVRDRRAGTDSGADATDGQRRPDAPGAATMQG